MSGSTMLVCSHRYVDAYLPLTISKALGHDKAQDIIDQITAAHESGAPPPPGGFGFGPPPGFGGPPFGGFPGGK